MDFDYEILFQGELQTVRREGKGKFYPHDAGFNLEHMLWLMAEEYGRPVSIAINMNFGR